MQGVAGLVWTWLKAAAAGAVAYVTIGGWLGLLLPMVFNPAARCEPVRLAIMVITFCDDARAAALWWALIGLPSRIVAAPAFFLLWALQEADPAEQDASVFVVRMHYDTTFAFDAANSLVYLAAVVLVSVAGVIGWRDASPRLAWFWALALTGVVLTVAWIIRP